MSNLSLTIKVVALAIAWTAARGAEDRPIRHTEFPEMVNHIALPYLPPERYSGDTNAPRGDYELLLSLHVPKTGTGPFPVVFYVHGGSWSGGSKEGQKELAAEFARRGIAYCGFNYILKPKGIFPQSWWDLHNAARFLRMHADRYNLDPLRFGAYGISAGGWVISSACMPGPDYLATSTTRAITASDLVKQGGKLKPRNPDDEFAWLKPMRDPAPAWPGEAGGFSAVSWDFCYHVEYGDAASPTVQQWAGLGAKPKYESVFTTAGGRLVVSEMTAPKYAGQHVHCPPFFKRGGKEAGDTLDLDGKPGKQLGEVMGDFFARELMSPAARPPAPEIYPTPPVVTGSVAVTLLAPRGVTIHYTTDGSEPTPASPVYRASFKVEPGVTVKAISAAPGMTPSGPAHATFMRGDPAPVVTGPEQLPPGKVGEPYTLTFQADRQPARWSIQGDLTPYVPFQQKETVYPNNMRMDAATGLWSGTPDRPGSFWIQVWVASGPGMLAGYRNYRWTVTGQALTKAPTEAVTSDQNVAFAVLKAWPSGDAQALLNAFSKSGLRVVTPDQPGDAQLMLVVHAEDRAKATELLRNFVAKNAALAGMTRVGDK